MELLCYPCSCCGFLTLTDPDSGSYEICPICLWENDPVQNEDPHFAGGANPASLNDARENYRRLGVAEPTLSNKTRHVRIDEVPYAPMLRGLDSANQAETQEKIDRLLLGIIRAILAGQIGILDGCAAAAGVGFELYDRDLVESMRTFEIVADEADEFPTGSAVNLSKAGALEAKRREAAEYEQRVEKTVLNACLEAKRILES